MSWIFDYSAQYCATISNWFTDFWRGQWPFEDEPQAGQLLTAVTPENIAAVQKMLLEEPHLIYVDDPRDLFNSC